MARMAVASLARHKRRSDTAAANSNPMSFAPLRSTC